MCRVYYTNCRGVSIASHGLFISCEEKISIFNWTSCERAQTRLVCEPTFHPDPAGNIGQCEDCEKIEKQNPKSLVEKLPSYQVHCPSQEPPSYALPQYIAPPQYFKSSNASVAGTLRPTRTFTHLQLPPNPQFIESPYADGSPRRRYTTEVNYAPSQQQKSLSSCFLQLSASDNSPNTRAAIATNNIDPANLLRPPPMPILPESPYVGTQKMPAYTNSEQQPIQCLPPVAQPINYRRLDGCYSHEEELPLEPRVLGLRSQWYENELQGPQKSLTWNTFSGWIRKTGEKLTGQGRSHQKARKLSRSEQLARQPRVKPQRRGIEAWVALSSNFPQGGQNMLQSPR